ncbi:MAG: YjbF family lipoprotein [Rhodanobacter sp.]
MQLDQPITVTRLAAPLAPRTPPRSSAKWRLWLLPLISLLCLSGLSGCSDLSRSSVDTIKLAIHKPKPIAPTAAEVAAKPYFQLQATSPQGTAVLILGNVDGARQAWYGSHQVILFIEHGRVVQTAGLAQNLAGFQLPAADPFKHGLQLITAPVSYKFTADWSPGYRFGVPVEATLTPAGATQITILGKVHQVLRYDEQLSAPLANYYATNHYWVDPSDGFVWQSEQSVAPGLSLKLMQLRPYRKAQP